MWDRQYEGIVTQCRYCTTPRWHIGECIGPAHEHESLLRSSPPIASPTHPVIGVMQPHAADPETGGQFNTPVGAEQCVCDPCSLFSVPLFKGMVATLALGFSSRFNDTVPDILYEPGEAVDTM